jgi:hypothetical protein
MGERGKLSAFRSPLSLGDSFLWRLMEAAAVLQDRERLPFAENREQEKTHDISKAYAWGLLVLHGLRGQARLRHAGANYHCSQACHSRTE